MLSHKLAGRFARVLTWSKAQTPRVVVGSFRLFPGGCRPYREPPHHPRPSITLCLHAARRAGLQEIRSITHITPLFCQPSLENGAT